MAPVIEEVVLGAEIGAWFTGRDTSGDGTGGSGNLSHSMPHRPTDLATARAVVGARTGTDPATWHHMRQVHGAEVGIVTAETPVGAELRGVDALVTTEVDRPLVVQVADCVPVLLAGSGVVAAVHAGRRGVEAGVVASAVAAVLALGSEAGQLRAVIGPAIGGCCYEVPGDLRDQVAEVAPWAPATTSWGTPALDLPEAVAGQLGSLGVRSVARSGGCTRCDPSGRWFSHRADPTAGRQIGLVVRRSPHADVPSGATGGDVSEVPS